MKKLGFTLAEIIIALTVIGVIAAITAPLVGNLIPDKNKAMVIKAHKTICDINRELLDDKSLYTSEISCRGLACQNAPDDPKYADYEEEYTGDGKYTMLLIDKLDVTSSDIDLTGTTNFKTADGLEWSVSIPKKEIVDGADEVSIELMIDTNTLDNAPNCYYSEKCKNPDQFKFLIGTYGNVKPDDAMTSAYMQNVYKFNDRKKDIQTAKEIYANSQKKPN